MNHTTFPDTPEFTGLYRPSRVEADIEQLEVSGTIPPQLRGTFYQVAPDPQFAPMLGNDIFFNGDGMVSAFRFDQGAVSLQRRYVLTERLQAQRRAGRSLTGVYRNVHTNDPLAAANNSTANTSVVEHAGVLLALKEDSLPYALDPATLATLGPWDFHGQIRSATFTAHPKVLPGGEMLSFAYEAKGDGTPDIAYFEFDRDGKLVRETWFQAPYAAMIHDFAVTEHYVIFPVIPLTVDVDRLRAGGAHFQWQPELPQLFGVLPRAGGGADVRWFRGPANCFQGHTLNAFEQDGKIHLDMPVTGGNIFYFFPEQSGFVPAPETLASCLMRWSFDLDATDDRVEPVALADFLCEFPRCDERVLGRPYEHGFMLAFDPALPYDGAALGPPPFQFFNQLVHLNLRTGAVDAWYGGDAECFQEPIFVPRSADAPEGDGYLVCLLNHLRDGSTDLVVLDTHDLAAGPVARVPIPLRMRMSLHGSWSPSVNNTLR